MTTAIDETREHLSRDVDALYDKVSPGRVVQRRKRAVRDRLVSARESVMGVRDSVADSVADSASGIGSDAADAVTGTARSAAGAVRSRTRGAPLAAGLVAFGAGMVASALIPASDAEERAARGLTEAVKDSPVLDQAQAAGREIGEHVQESAKQAAQEVRASVEESVATVKDEGAAGAQSVKDDAPGS